MPVNSPAYVSRHCCGRHYHDLWRHFIDPCNTIGI